MKVLVVGLGNQGRKRAHVAGEALAATVDPIAPEATYRRLDQVPPESYQAAMVCTPDAAKPALIRSLLESGKHVLVEKPLLQAAEDLLQLARERGVACYTAYNHRFEPLVVKLKERLPDLGRVYSGSFYYGNGTARDVRDSPWRDHGRGVLSDLGSHLFDLWRFLFPEHRLPLQLWAGHSHENRAWDHFRAGTTCEPGWMFEASLLSWRNHFCIDLVGERGSLTLKGLCKWGPSCLTWRRRRLPSGKPDEERWILEQPDPTWEAEFGYFLELCGRGENNLSNDVWLQGLFELLGAQSC